jgi:hypothetical protein
MKSTLRIAAVSVALLFLMGASSTTRPILPDCGGYLPEGARYSVTLHGTWDTRSGADQSRISITLKDELTGHAPSQVPEEAEQFAQCLRAVIGLQE